MDLIVFDRLLVLGLGGLCFCDTVVVSPCCILACNHLFGLWPSSSYFAEACQGEPEREGRNFGKARPGSMQGYFCYAYGYSCVVLLSIIVLRT